MLNTELQQRCYCFARRVNTCVLARDLCRDAERYSNSTCTDRDRNLCPNDDAFVGTTGTTDTTGATGTMSYQSAYEQFGSLVRAGTATPEQRNQLFGAIRAALPTMNDTERQFYQSFLNEFDTTGTTGTTDTSGTTGSTGTSGGNGGCFCFNPSTATRSRRCVPASSGECDTYYNERYSNSTCSSQDQAVCQDFVPPRVCCSPSGQCGFNNGDLPSFACTEYYHGGSPVRFGFSTPQECAAAGCIPLSNGGPSPRPFIR